MEGALEVLGPVLIERATQGGVRVYHESFARYLRTPFQDNAPAETALLERITGWLEGKGLFVDARAFHSLLPLLAEAGQDGQIVNLVDRQFVTKAVAAGFAASTINANLATAVGAAARLGEWPTVVRYVELSRAAESYQTERFDSTLVAFVDVPAALLGADTVAARLLDDDRLVMPARAGLQMCAAVDSLGAPAPWRAYMEGYLREAESDNTSYGEASDDAVELAWLRGRLRLAAPSVTVESEATSASGGTHDESGDGADDQPDERWDLMAPFNWSRLAQWVEHRDLPASDVIDAVLDTHGWDGSIRLVHSLEGPGGACKRTTTPAVGTRRRSSGLGAHRRRTGPATVARTHPPSPRILRPLGEWPCRRLVGCVRACGSRGSTGNQRSRSRGRWRGLVSVLAPLRPHAVSSRRGSIDGKRPYRAPSSLSFDRRPQTLRR